MATKVGFANEWYKFCEINNIFNENITNTINESITDILNAAELDATKKLMVNQVVRLRKIATRLKL